MATRNTRATCSIDVANRCVKVEDVERPNEPVVVYVDRLNADMKLFAALLGISNKLRDSYAKPDVSPFEAASAVAENLEAGLWRASGGERGETATYFVRAWAKLKNISVEDAMRVVNEIEASEDEKRMANLKIARKHPQVVRLMAEMKAADAAARAERLRERNEAAATDIGAIEL